MLSDYTITTRPVDDGWVEASLVELPGVITCAPSEAEARALLADALAEYLAD